MFSVKAKCRYCCKEGATNQTGILSYLLAGID